MYRLADKYPDPPDERPNHPDPPDEQKISSFLDKIIRTPGQNHPDPRVKTKTKKNGINKITKKKEKKRRDKNNYTKTTKNEGYFFMASNDAEGHDDQNAY